MLNLKTSLDTDSFIFSLIAKMLSEELKRQIEKMNRLKNEKELTWKAFRNHMLAQNPNSLKRFVDLGCMDNEEFIYWYQTT